MIAVVALAVTIALLAAAAGVVAALARRVDPPRPAKPALFDVHAGQACPPVGTCVCAGCLDARWLHAFGQMTERAMTGRVRWIGGR